MFPIKTANNHIILDMTHTYTKAKEASILFCRACLSSDGSLFDMTENDLINVFSRLVGIPVMNDKLPKYLCMYCQALLLKCASFKDKCGQIHKRLLRELRDGKLNGEVIRRLNRTSKKILDLTSTGVEIIDCAPSKVINYDETPNDMDMDTETVEYLDEDILLVEDFHYTETIDVEDTTYEPNVDEFNRNNISKRNDIALNKVPGNKKTKATKKEKTEKVAKLKLEKCLKKDQENSLVTDTMATEDDDKRHVLYNYNLPMKAEVNLANEDDNGGKRNVNKLVFGDLDRDIKEEIMGEARNKTFENNYSVRILVLSKEEQLAEVLARKESRNYQESEYRCEQCFKGFVLKTTFENHMLKHNPSVGAFSCEICHTRFAKKNHWQRHLASHRLKIICTECGFVTRTRGTAMQHYASHAGKTYDCPHCGKRFIKRTTFLGHVRLAHPAQNVACELCGEMFVGETGLRMHKARVHAEKIKCTVCSAKFANLAALNKHMDTAREHIDTPCEQCGENCASETALQEHLGLMHPTESHLCRTCDISFPSALAYETHVLRKHRQLSYTKAGPRGPQPKYRQRRVRRVDRIDRVDRDLLPSSHMCEQCGKIMPNALKLRYHQLVHRAAKPFVCDLCQRGFTLKTLLILHMRVHTGEKPFQCPECPRAFSAKTNWKRHYKAVHLGVRGSFTCHICGSTVTTKDGLRVHIDAKHGDKGWPKSRKRVKHASTTAENKA